ncbi:MAG: hypothetical protein HYU86_02065 [Chloroflexi bacterium]|nr:hypothetical protein [Chloroflexota bacterium]
MAISRELSKKTLWWLKACHRCGGDLVEEYDLYGSYINCFQCGRELSAEEERQLRLGRTPTGVQVAPSVISPELNKENNRAA